MKIFIVAVDVSRKNWTSDVQEVTEEQLEKLEQGLHDFANTSNINMVIDGVNTHLNVSNLVAIYVRKI